MDRKMSRAAGVGLEETDYHRDSQVSEPCRGGMRRCRSPSKSTKLGRRSVAPQVVLSTKENETPRELGLAVDEGYRQDPAQRW